MEQQLFPLNKEDFSKLLQQITAEEFGFILYKKPLSSDIFLMIHDENAKKISFQFQSFDSTNFTSIKSDILLKNNDLFKGNIFDQAKKISTQSTSFNKYASSKEYEKYVATIQSEIDQGKLIKAVAARVKKLALQASFDVAKLFIDFYTNYPAAFVYLTKNSLGFWAGATPELLLKKEQDTFSTVALAGTKLRRENRDWTSKEQEEQEIVSDYILGSLNKLGAQNIQCSPSYTVDAGHLQHIKTDIYFEYQAGIAKVLKELHPTPAVCGMPLEAAKQLILEKEKDARSLYSGYLGLEQEGFYFVNLRCMQIFDQHVDLYVGAGITSASQPHLEWLETEAKAETMGKFLV